MTSHEEGNGKTEQELLEWFKNDLLPRLIAENKFPIPGTNPENLIQISIDFEEDECKGVDSFASTPYFLKLTLQDKNDKEKVGEFRLIVKFITQNHACRSAMETDVQFYNEMIFYNELVPAFQDYLKGRPGIEANFLESIFPVCRYAHIDMDAADYGIVIMDDLRTENFKLAASKAELELDYCQLAVKKLAQMHALSYAMKIDNYPGFEDLRFKFQECRFQDDRFKGEKDEIFFKVTSERAIDYLLTKENEIPKSYLKMLKEKIASGAYKLMQHMIAPHEPIATICHGDFCRNNIMFRIENDGRPTDVRLFDFQTWRYSSPSIDLAFFIYMNTTLELRTKHFDEILKCYYDTLTKTVSKMTTKKFDLTLESFRADFGQHSLYGYIIASFFLPMMMFPKIGFDFENDWSDKTNEEMAAENAAQGGEIATIRLAEILIDMYRRGYYVS